LILGATTGSITGEFALPATLLISILLVHFVDKPLETWRQRRIQKILASAERLQID